jgi:hypothetical protein
MQMEQRWGGRIWRGSLQQARICHGRRRPQGGDQWGPHGGDRRRHEEAPALPRCFAHPSPTRPRPAPHGADDGDKADGGGGVDRPLPAPAVREAVRAVGRGFVAAARRGGGGGGGSRRLGARERRHREGDAWRQVRRSGGGSAEG